MPIYEFCCPACGFEFEELLALGQGADCGQCGRQGANRKISEFHPPSRRISGIAKVPRPDLPQFAPCPREADFNGMQIKNVRISNAHVGLGIGPNGRVRSRGLQIDNCDVGIDNAGSFDGPDTIIK
jgi:putative FmdB family regulatory protein